LGGEGDLLRTARALLMRPVGMGRLSGLGDAATAGQAKPAALVWSADRRLPPELATRGICAGDVALLRLLLALRSAAAAVAALGERACLAGNLPPYWGRLLEWVEGVV
jgi:hypothetical protein